MTSYFDTSALVAIYINEAFSRRARQEARATGAIGLTPLHELELTNALRLLVGRRILATRQLEQLMGHFEEDRAARRLVAIPLDFGEVFSRARELSEAHARRFLCRSLDVLHVSAAVLSGADRLVSADDRQLRLARAVGLRGVDIKKRSSARSRDQTS